MFFMWKVNSGGKLCVQIYYHYNKAVVLCTDATAIRFEMEQHLQWYLWHEQRDWVGESINHPTLITQQ